MVDILQLISLGGIFGLVGFVWKIASGNKKKVSYESFDRYKKDAEEKFRGKEVCDVLHKQISEDMKEVKEKVDCISAIKLGVDLLLKKNGLKTDE